MMRHIATPAVLLCVAVLLPACTRVHVEIRQPAQETKPSRDLPGGLKSDPSDLPEGPTERRVQPGGAAIPSQFIILTQGANTCAADIHETRAVAQQTDVWCWAASAEGVLSGHGVNLPQCYGVTKVKAEDRKTEEGQPYCCTNILDGICQQNGWTHQVFDAFGIRYYWWDSPLSQEQVAKQICGNGPFSYSIAYVGGGGHTLVVKDYSIDDTGEMSLWVDDHEYFTDGDGNRYAAGFKIFSYTQYAQGWYQGSSHAIDYTYYRILPQD